jgi:hypothetical protein
MYRIRMSGTIRLLAPYVFMAYRRITLLSNFVLVIGKYMDLQEVHCGGHGLD